MMRQLWNDDRGGVTSVEMILILSLLVIAMVVGYDIHEAILEDLADIAQACADLDQSFSYGGVFSDSGETAGSAFTDERDFCDGPGGEQRSKCVLICTAATPERGT